MPPLDNTTPFKLLDEYATDKPSSPAAPATEPGAASSGGFKLLDEFAPDTTKPAEPAPLADVVAPQPQPQPQSSVLPPPAPVMTAPSNMPTFDDQPPQVAPAPAPAAVPPVPAPAEVPPIPTMVVKPPGSLMSRVDPMALADVVAGQQEGVPGTSGSLMFQPEDNRVGIGGGFGLGVQQSMEEGRRLARGGAFSEPPSPDLPEMTLGGRLAFGIGHGLPTTAAAGLAGGAGGAAGGAMFGPVGATVGGISGAAIGAGAMSYAQALIPAYDQAIRSGAKTHEEAMDYAYKTAAVSGLFGTATGALFAWAPFKNAVSNAMLHIMGTAPVTSVGQQVTQAAVTGEPLPSPGQMAETAVESAASAGVIHGMTQAGRAVGERLRSPPPDRTFPEVKVPPQEGGAGGGQGQLGAPVKQLGGPGDQEVPTPGQGTGEAVTQPDQETPIVPFPKPADELPRIQPVDEKPLVGGDQGQTGGDQQKPVVVLPTPKPVDGDIQPDQKEPPDQEPLVDTSDKPTQVKDGGPGSAVTVKTNVPDVSLDTTYRVVETSDLKPATGDLQPRDRAGRQGSDVQIAENAARLDPFRLGAHNFAEHGAPVVTQDGTVLAGNGRLATIQRAAEQHPDKYEAYKQHLTDLGHDLSGFQQPVLVRQATGDLTPDEQRKFAEASNVPGAMAMSPVEQAKVDARNLSDTALDKFDASKPVTSPANLGFLREWLGTIPHTEHNRLIQAGGGLSQAGIQRLQGAVLAKAYAHDPLLTRALESPTDDVKSVTGSLMDAAAPYAKLKSQIAQGKLPKEFDITHHIAQALDLMTQARAKGIQPGDILKQTDMFSGKLDPLTEQVIRTFYNDSLTRLRSRKGMTDILHNYVQDALAVQPGKDLLGNEANPTDLLAKARGGGQKGDDQAALISAIPGMSAIENQIKLAEGGIARARAANKSPQDIAQQEKQLGLLQARRDALLKGATAPETKTAVTTEPETKPELKSEPVPADDEEPAQDEDLAAIDKLSPEELFAGEEDTRNTTVARNPSEQASLDKANQSIERLHRELDRAYKANKGLSVTGKLERDLAIATRRRDALTAGDISDERKVEARIKGGQFRPKPTRKPPSPHRIRQPGEPLDFADYTFRTRNTQVAQQAFADAGVDPNLATSRPLAWQINVLTRQTKKQFGFKDVTVDPTMDKLQARDVLLETYRAGTDGMASLGYAPDALGLFGTVSLNLVPYSPKLDYSGQYVFKNKTIDLVGTANSLGHEWTHALDHWLLDQMYPGGRTQPYPLASAEAAAVGGDPQDDMAKRFGRVLQTLFYDEAELASNIARLEAAAQRLGPSARQAQYELDMLKTGGETAGIKASRFRTVANAYQQAVDPGKDYYGSILEMIARAHEAFISREMEDNGVDPRGFVMAQAAYLTDTVRGLNVIYPKEPERTAIYNAFAHLHAGLHNMLLTGKPVGIFANKNQTVDLKDFEFQGRLPPGAYNAIKRAYMETVADVKEWRVSLALMRPFDKNRPISHYTVWQRVRRLFYRIVKSPMGQLDVMLHMNNDPAVKALLRQIMDMLGVVPGDVKHINPKPTFEERYISLLHRWGHTYTQIMKTHHLTARDLVRMEENGVPANKMIHYGMTTMGPIPGVFEGHILPPNMRQAIGRLRQLGDEIFQSLRDAGVDIQYTENGHFPRVYDHLRIWNDPAAFKADATKLFKFMFDKDVGPAGDNPEALLDRWRQLSKEQRQMADQQLQDGMVELARTLRKLAGMPRRIADLQRELQRVANGQLNYTPKQVAALHRRLAKAQAVQTQLQAEAKQLAAQWHHPAGDHVAYLGAAEWVYRVVVGYQTDFDTIGPSGSFLNHRVLPPEADDIMRDWIITDVNTALFRYYNAAARKQSYYEILGPNQDKFEALLSQMEAAGGYGEDIRMIRDIADRVTGRGNFRNARGMSKAVTWIKALTAVKMLGQSWLAMIGEPAIGGIALRNMKVTLKSYAAQLDAQFSSMDAQERAEFADMTGVTVSAAYDDMLNNRMGVDFADSPRLGVLSSTMYRVMGQTSFNTSNRRAATQGVGWAMANWANNWLKHQAYRGPKRGPAWRKLHERGEVANNWFNEGGIPADKAFRKGFMDWIISHDGVPTAGGQGGLPSPTGPGGSRVGRVRGRLPEPRAFQEDDYRPAYELMMNRLVNRMVQNPMASNIPNFGINDPMVSALLQFQAFSFSMQDNVLDPAMMSIPQRAERARERARIEHRGPLGVALAGVGGGFIEAANIASTMLTAVVAQIPGAYVRLRVYHPDVYERIRKEEGIGEYLFDYAMNQAGLNGALSMPLQALSQIRYNSSPEGMFTGPGLSNISRDLGDIFLAFTGGGESETNTRPYLAARAAYNELMVPTIAYGAAMLGGGFGTFATGMTGLAYSFAASRPASDLFASTLFGEKGVSRPKPPKEGLAGLQELEQQIGKLGQPEGVPSEKEIMGEDEGDAGPHGSHGTTSAVPWGLLDDFALPVAKALWPYVSHLNQLPKWAKVTGAAGLAYWGGSEFLNWTEDWRNAPPPTPKSTGPP